MQAKRLTPILNVSKLTNTLALDAPVYASVLATPTHAYVASETGHIYTIEVNDTGLRLAATEKLGESIFASPSAANGNLWIRTDSGLLRIIAR